MIYLASPYSDPNYAVRERRFIKVCECAAALIGRGVHVFSPIAHSHPIAKHGGLETDTDWTFWQGYDYEMISLCEEVWVLELFGWSASAGIKAEVEFAMQSGKPVKYINYTEIMDGDNARNENN